MVFREKVGERFLWREPPGQDSFRCYPRSTLCAVDVRPDGKKMGGTGEGGPRGEDTFRDLGRAPLSFPPKPQGYHQGGRLLLIWGE